MKLFTNYTGHDGTRLWDLQRMSEIPGRPAIAGTRGSTTAITWASRDDDPGETLFYGTVHGHLVCWRQMVRKQCCGRLDTNHVLGKSRFPRVLLPPDRSAIGNQWSSIRQSLQPSRCLQPQRGDSTVYVEFVSPPRNTLLSNGYKL